MDLKDQKYMAALAGEGSLTKAARRLNLSQPALSKWLRDLEQELGLSLVIRSRQGLIFTEAGQIYLEGCRECLEAALDIRRKLDALSQSKASSWAEAPYGAPRLLPKYFRISDVSIRISTCSL